MNIDKTDDQKVEIELEDADPWTYLVTNITSEEVLHTKEHLQ